MSVLLFGNRAIYYLGKEIRNITYFAMSLTIQGFQKHQGFKLTCEMSATARKQDFNLLDVLIQVLSDQSPVFS